MRYTNRHFTYLLTTGTDARNTRHLQRRRSIVKYVAVRVSQGQGQGQSGQAIKLFQTPRKLVLPSILTQVFHPPCAYEVTIVWRYRNSILLLLLLLFYLRYLFPREV